MHVAEKHPERGEKDGSRELSVWNSREVSDGRPKRMEEKNQDTRRRRKGRDAGENRFGGGSDPTLSGLSAAQPVRQAGGPTPQGSVHFASSVAGRFASEVSGKTKYSS